ncbi:hypothetical protein SELMODRAFT_448754 [Selaginella moellendorffii]|uniref:Myb-like domain-containing protein n=1 Tax=Selaginella moellendorffii TaxID=88036 RepID=D8T9Y2_SELML|nr:hypothetical protein SELMODRAFT_448754 [Selaginella moellendorffii]
MVRVWGSGIQRGGAARGVRSNRGGGAFGAGGRAPGPAVARGGRLPQGRGHGDADLSNFGLNQGGVGAGAQGAIARGVGARGAVAQGVGASPPTASRTQLFSEFSSTTTNEFWFHNLEEQDVAVEQEVEEDDRGDEEEGDDDEEGEAGVHVVKKVRKKRRKNWGDDETASLIDFKREDHLGKIGAMRGSEEMTLTATNRWKRIAKKMQAAGMQRDWKVCQTRWNNLCNNYKCVYNFQRKTGNPDYFNEDAKRLMLVKLNLKVFPVEYFNIMDEFLAKQASTSPTFLADSDAPEEEAYEEDPADGVDPPGDATQVPGSSGKRKNPKKAEKRMTTLLAEGNALAAARNEQNLAWQKESIVCMKENSLAEKEKAATATVLAGAISNLASSIFNFLNGATSRS